MEALTFIIGLSRSTFRGGYRGRTDDLLRARQALWPTELIPLKEGKTITCRIYMGKTRVIIDTEDLWACADSNRRPLHYQCSALTT